MSSYAQSIGITHRLSCPHTHEQNGAPERRNRTIVEKGLTLLAHACLPYQYWEHAFSTATYLHNCTITPILSLKSPYQALYYHPPDYQLLRKLGVCATLFYVLTIIIKLIFALFHVSSWVIVRSIKVIYVIIPPPIGCTLLVM